MNIILKYFFTSTFLLLLTFNLIKCVSKDVVENNFAFEAYKEGRYLTAITYSKKVLEKDPSNYQAVMIKGKSNLKLNNYQEAITDFDNAINIKKGFEPYYYRARTYLELNEFENASKDLEKALYYNPTNVDALFNYAYVQTLLDNYEVALEAYNKVVSVDPLNSNAYVNIGNLLGRMGDSELAIQYFTKAINLKPNDALAYFNRATEKLIIKDKKGAIKDLTKSVSIDSNNINSYFLLAETMIQVKDYKGANKILSKITSIDPQNARAYYLKGTSELASNEKDKACVDLRKAGELGYYDAYELITKNCLKKEKIKSKR